MNKTLLSNENFALASSFSKITGSIATDVFEAKDYTLFFVPKTQMAIAIGKNGVNVKKVMSILKRPIRIVAQSQTPEELAKNMLYPLDLEVSGDSQKSLTLHLKTPSQHSKAFKDSLRLLKEVLRQKYNFKGYLTIKE